MKLVDAHIHLYSIEYRNSIGKVVDEAKENSVSAILCVAEDYKSSIDTLNIASKYDVVYPLIGIHPWTSLHSFYQLSDIVKLIKEKITEIIGLGEVGLDKKYEADEKGWIMQQNAFKKMVELSVEYRKPLNIHSRKAAKEVLEILRAYNVKKAHFHWFTDNEKILREIVSEGYYVAFTPSITYSKRIQRLAKIVPPKQILTETDGPISFFGELRGELTRPSHVKIVLRELAEIHDIDTEKMAEIIWKNFTELYLR